MQSVCCDARVFTPFTSAFDVHTGYLLSFNWVCVLCVLRIVLFYWHINSYLERCALQLSLGEGGAGLETAMAMAAKELVSLLNDSELAYINRETIRDDKGEALQSNQTSTCMSCLVWSMHSGALPLNITRPVEHSRADCEWWLRCRWTGTCDYLALVNKPNAYILESMCACSTYIQPWCTAHYGFHMPMVRPHGNT